MTHYKYLFIIISFFVKYYIYYFSYNLIYLYNVLLPKPIIFANDIEEKEFYWQTEKEPTDALLKLSIYYKFSFRFCNAYCGNEKGHVEKSVELIRRKAFSKNIDFHSLEAANHHLKQILDEINSKCPSGKNISTKDLLEEDRINFMPAMPLYETASVHDAKVSKYSTIMIDSCQYSLPDQYVDRLLRCKVYTNKILIFDDDKKIGEHDKITDFNKWKLDINHYTYTLFRKPKALVNSTAFKQMDSILQDIYNEYFKNNEKEFILLLNCVGKAVDNSINNLKETCPNNITLDKIEFLCLKKEEDNLIYLSDYKDEITNML